MGIKFSVVGLFFGVELPLKGPQQVLNVLQAAKVMAPVLNANVRSFDFHTVTGQQNVALHAFSIDYINEVTGRKVGNMYPAGHYFLAENPNGSPTYTVWQYYVLNEDGTSATNGTVRFLNDPAAIVPENGSLIWRLVTIAKVPTGPMSHATKGRLA